jgi:hypothetical protein
VDKNMNGQGLFAMNSRLLRRLTWLSVVLTPLALGGCGKGSNARNALVQGNVTIDGELARRGSVTFYPSGDGPVATGQILADGSYSLRIGQGNMGDPDASKIFSGEYVATVLVNDPADKSQTISEGGPPVAGPRLTAIKYSRKETSGLVFAVKPGRNVFSLVLEGAASDPPTDGTGEETDIADGTMPAEESGQTNEDTTIDQVETPRDAHGNSEEAGKDALQNISETKDGAGVSK